MLEKRRKGERVGKGHKKQQSPGEVQADLQDGSIIFRFFPVKQDRQIGWKIQFRDYTGPLELHIPTHTKHKHHQNYL